MRFDPNEWTSTKGRKMTATMLSKIDVRADGDVAVNVTNKEGVTALLGYGNRVTGTVSQSDTVEVAPSSGVTAYLKTGVSRKVDYSDEERPETFTSLEIKQLTQAEAIVALGMRQIREEGRKVQRATARLERREKRLEHAQANFDARQKAGELADGEERPTDETFEDIKETGGAEE